MADLARTHSGIAEATPSLVSANEVFKVLANVDLDLLRVAGHGRFETDQPNEPALTLSDSSLFRAIDLTRAIASQIG